MARLQKHTKYILITVSTFLTCCLAGYIGLGYFINEVLNSPEKVRSHIYEEAMKHNPKGQELIPVFFKANPQQLRLMDETTILHSDNWDVYPIYPLAEEGKAYPECTEKALGSNLASMHGKSIYPLLQGICGAHNIAHFKVSTGDHAVFPAGTLLVLSHKEGQKICPIQQPTTISIEAVLGISKGKMIKKPVYRIECLNGIVYR